MMYQQAVVLQRHWLFLVNGLMGTFVGLPWLAPMLMASGYDAPATAIYAAYGLICHQLPQLSYFLFGQKLIYSLPEIQRVWPFSDPALLRQFLGLPAMGYKVAYSERMVTLFTTIFYGGLLFSLVRSRLRPLGILLFLLIGVVPIGLDGFSHLLSDRTGWGFRDTNAWLAWLTSYRFAPSFYVGDAVGSANWWLRQVTGLLSGLAIVWLVYPGIEQRITRNQADYWARGHKRLPAKPKQEGGTAKTAG